MPDSQGPHAEESGIARSVGPFWTADITAALIEITSPYRRR